jgi:hypothetical protein
MSGETNKLLTIAALVAAISSLAIALLQRLEIRDLRRKVESRGQLDDLIESVRDQHLEQLRHIERLNPDFKKTLEDFKLPKVDPTLQQEIDKADLVLMTESQIKDDRLVQVVTQVIKLKADAVSYFDVGHPIGSPTPLDGFTANPEGSIVFCSGSPAEPGTASFIYNGRIRSYSDIPAVSAIMLIEEAAAKR